MPIPIKCPHCQQQYHVDEKLGGKKVRCRNCQGIISVGGDLPDLPTLEGVDDGSSSPGERASLNCPSCKAPVPRQSRVCLACGYNLHGGPASAAAAEETPSFIDDKKKRRWQRPPESSMLATIDQMLKMGTLLLFVGGMIAWVVHIITGGGEVTFRTFLPLIVAVVLMAGLLAPLIAYAVGATLRKLKILPRDDTYVRALVVMMLPFSLNLFSEVPVVGEFIAPLVVLLWGLSPALILYLYRGELTEALASFTAAFCALGVGVLVIALGAGTVNNLIGPLYGDMVPAGPWRSFAHGQSPVVVPEVATGGQPPNPGTTLAGVTNPPTVPPVPVPVPPTPNGVAVPPPTPPTQVAVGPGPEPSATTSQPAPVPNVATASTNDVLLKLVESPWLAGTVANEPGLAAVQELSAAPIPVPAFLAVRHEQSVAAVEMWSIGPPSKRGDFSFPLFPKKANAYAVNPRGDGLTALIHFPRLQLEVVSLDTRIPKRTIPLEEPKAAPTLVGYLDPLRVCVRWDLPDPSDPARVATRFQIWAAGSGSQGRPFPTGAALDLDSNPNGMALSAEGRFLALLTRDQQLLIVNTETGTLLKRIVPAGNLGFKLVSMSFSPDSTQIALYAVVADIPTIMAFKVISGDPSGSSILTTPVPPALLAEPVAHNHALLWMQGGQYWLVNGSEVIDVARGKRVASLAGERAVVEARLVGPDTILFVLPQGDARRVVVSRVNFQRLQAESEKLR